MLAISTDDLETMKKFRSELKAGYPFIPDPEAEITSLYGVKAPAMKLAMRTTFVIGPDRKILRVDRGGDAIDPSGAIAACPVKKLGP